MMDNKENLEGIVAKLKEQGIQAGENEKDRLIAEAKKEADQIIAKAKQQSTDIVAQANDAAAQVQKNATAAMVQASRDVVEATKIAVIEQLKTAFGKQSKALFTQDQYLQEVLKALVVSIDGKQEVSLAQDKIAAMEAFLVKEALNDNVVLKPLTSSSAKIQIKSTEKAGIQFVLSTEDVQDGLFSLLNKELLERISAKKED